ncbi:hypothetical protein, partial [Amycolatopsis sp. NPDC051061]|uniref:hypothetical protein n=1 Tax=Amycolatopsis sp. NPDC051061 TaxID=3155042 RepID=UPI0034304CE3
GQRRQQATHVGTGPASRFRPMEPSRDLRKQVNQTRHPGSQVIITQHKIDTLHRHYHEVPLEY